MYHNYIEELNLKPDEVIVYLRKSRADDPLISVEEVLKRHEEILDEWAIKSLGEVIPEKNKYREIVSGETIEDRPEIQKILKLIESPKIKAILIVEVQRLSRGDLEDAGRLMKLLRYTNTIVITPTKIYDLHDEYDRDAFERELKRGNDYLEYTKKIMNRGRLRSISEGNYIGSIPPYGYDKVWITEGKMKYPTLSIKPDEANAVRIIFDLYVNECIGTAKIAKQLDNLGITPPKGDHWSCHTVNNILMNIHYCGKVKWNHRKVVTVVEDSQIVKMRPTSKTGEYLIYEGKHEAIISEDLFNAAQERMGKNHRTKASTKVRNPLAGLLYCRCGRAMSLRMQKKNDGTDRYQPRLMCDGQVHCKTGSCTYDEIEQHVISVLRDCIADFEVRIKNSQSDAMKLQETHIKNLEKKMQDLEAKELAQWEAQADPDPANRMPQEIFRKLNEKLQKEKEEVKEAMCNARKSMPNPVDYQDKLVRFRDALNAMTDPNADAESKNNLLKKCIDRIEYYREAPQRATNPEKRTRKNGRKKGVSLKPNPLKSGAQWTTPPINIDVKLKV